MNQLARISSLLVGLSFMAQAMAADYSDRAEVKEFINKMVEEHGFAAQDVRNALAQAEKKQKIIDAISRPAEKTKPWYEYRDIFMGQDRIDQGVQFWEENTETLEQAEKVYGVEPSVIVAIIGVETRYGRYKGSYRVIDALATLGFDYPPRAKFFLGQLEQLFLLAREQKQDPLTLTGSYAGAMGYGQFIPSSYRHYARDFDEDGFADIWNNRKDAIGSVANYFKAHGWQTGKPVVAPVTLTKPLPEKWINQSSRPDTSVQTWMERGVRSDEKIDAELDAVLLEYAQPEAKEYWLGFNNFYVITRYNRSHMYAMAVWQLSEAIAQAKAAKNDKIKTKS